MTASNESGDEMNRDHERLVEAIQPLMEHFDAVQIFSTRYDPESGQTYTYSTGKGNWNSRKGTVGDWVKKEDEAIRVQVRKDSDE